MTGRTANVACHALFGLLCLTGAMPVAMGQTMPAVIPDEWLLASRGPSWWYTSQASSIPFPLASRAPTEAEQALVARARALVAQHPIKAIALVDGAAIVYTEYKPPASDESLFAGYSMGKTATAMAVGQAICAGKLTLDTRAADLTPELAKRPLGNATVRDLLRMASGAAEPTSSDGALMTPQQFKDWQSGSLNLLEFAAEERIAQTARGVFSAYKPGEHCFYKNTDPLVLGLMLNQATGLVYAKWVQQMVLDPMGTAKTGLIAQDRLQHGLAEAAMRLRLEDWVRFGWWVKQSSKETGCFGDFVREAIRTQIANSSPRAARKNGKLFRGYGYLTWTENEIAPNTYWAAGYGGQRIGWNHENSRMVVVFSNAEEWMPDFYELAKDWNALKSSTASAGSLTRAAPSARTAAKKPSSEPALTLEQQLDLNDKEGDAMIDAVKAKDK